MNVPGGGAMGDGAALGVEFWLISLGDCGINNCGIWKQRLGVDSGWQTTLATLRLLETKREIHYST